jgi:hypothetical protein
MEFEKEKKEFKEERRNFGQKEFGAEKCNFSVRVSLLQFL